MLLAEEDGELLGFSACGESRDDDADPSVGEVRSFFVAAGRWGQGVGTRADGRGAGRPARARLHRGDGLVLRGQRARQRLLRARAASRATARRGPRSRGRTCPRSATAVASEPCASRTSGGWRRSSPRTAPRSGSWPASRRATRENQSLAEATVPPGGETEEHYHRASEEIYSSRTAAGGCGLGDEESEVTVGDTVVIAPGVAAQALEHRPRAAPAPVLLLAAVLARGHVPNRVGRDPAKRATLVVQHAARLVLVLLLSRGLPQRTREQDPDGHARLAAARRHAKTSGQVS